MTTPNMPKMDEQEAYLARTRKPIITMPQTRWGKALFFVGLMLWFGLLMLPCACFYLAAFGQITLANRDIPDVESHPLLEISLIMEIEQRGLKFVRSGIHSQDESNLCLQTSVQYALWQSDGTASNVVYCDCYQRETPQANWQLANATYQACENGAK
jgi:hypothetical protein